MNIQGGLVRKWACIPVLLTLFVLLAACSGGTEVAGGGTGGTGYSTGVITAFGSVWVNGVEYGTDAATIRKRLDDSVDNLAGYDDDVFRRGMVVTVRHGLSDNRALEIDYQSNVEGPIFAINPADNTIVVLGLSVHVDAATWLYDDTGVPLTSFADLQVGNVVEVSGLSDSNDILHATYLERKRAAPHDSEEFEVKGYVSGLDAVAKTFRIGPTPAAGTIQVSYDDSTELDGLANGLENGLYVEVKTNSADGGTILATEVDGKSEAAGGAKEGSTVVIEGYPVGIDPIDRKFFMDGVRVAAAGADYIPSGRGFSDITTATKMRAEGTMERGELVASRITFE
jgi:hypothetical protein